MTTPIPTGYYPTNLANTNALSGFDPSIYSSILNGSNYGLGAQPKADYQKILDGEAQMRSSGDALAYVVQALGAGDNAAAQQLMQKTGVTPQQVEAQLGSTPGRFGGSLGKIAGTIKDVVQPIGQYATEHPAAIFAAPFIAAGALGAFGASLGAGGGAAAGVGNIGASGYGISPGFVGGGAAGGASSADILGAGGLFGAGGAPSTLAGLGGGGASAFGPAAAGAVSAGTAGLGTLGGLGAGLGTGLGVGSVPAAGAGMAGLATGEGTIAGSLTAGADTLAAAGAGGGGIGAALGGLGLPGWLTVGSLAAGALQGNKDQTTTTTNAPPAYIAPYLSQAAGAAADQYGKGAYVSPLQQAAVGYGTNVLNGSYLNSNPYLDATFNRAAGAVTNQVQSNFGTAGRNVRGPDAAGTAQYGAAGAGGGYDDLANLIYGGNYQAERNRQQQILPMTNDLGRIGNPSTALDDYIARLRNISGGYGSTTSSTPTQSNLYSGLAGLGLALIPGG